MTPANRKDALRPVTKPAFVGGDAPHVLVPGGDRLADQAHDAHVGVGGALLAGSVQSSHHEVAHNLPSLKLDGDAAVAPDEIEDGVVAPLFELVTEGVAGSRKDDELGARDVLR